MFTTYLALSFSPTLKTATSGITFRSSSAGEVRTWFIEEAICRAVSSACVWHKPFCSAAREQEHYRGEAHDEENHCEAREH